MIEESIIGAGLTALAIGTGVISYAIPALLNFTFGEKVASYPHELVIDWYSDNKVAEIIDRLRKDEDITTFFKQPRYKQQRGWRELIKSKLSEGELKYIDKITKTKFE